MDLSGPCAPPPGLYRRLSAAAGSVRRSAAGPALRHLLGLLGWREEVHVGCGVLGSRPAQSDQPEPEPAPHLHPQSKCSRHPHSPEGNCGTRLMAFADAGASPGCQRRPTPIPAGRTTPLRPHFLCQPRCGSPPRWERGVVGVDSAGNCTRAPSSAPAKPRSAAALTVPPRRGGPSEDVEGGQAGTLEAACQPPVPGLSRPRSRAQRGDAVMRDHARTVRDARRTPVVCQARPPASHTRLRSLLATPVTASRWPVKAATRTQSAAPPDEASYYRPDVRHEENESRARASRGDEPRARGLSRALGPRGSANSRPGLLDGQYFQGLPTQAGARVFAL